MPSIASGVNFESIGAFEAEIQVLKRRYCLGKTTNAYYNLLTTSSQIF